MLKPLTAEGRFECGLDDVMRNKIWAFVAVIGENYAARMGAAVANEPGYNPIPEHWAHADSLDAMQAHADELNEAKGLSRAMAVEIVISTMGGRPLLIVEKEGERAAEYRMKTGGRQRRGSFA